MAKDFEKERRQALRAKRILSIQFRLAQSKAKNTDKNWHLSTTHDMSILGISFLSEIPFLIDDIIELQIVMSGVVDIFKGYGQVVRIQKKTRGSYYLVAVKLVKKLPSAKKITKRKVVASRKVPNKKSVKKHKYK